MRITVLTDDARGWFVPYARELGLRLKERDHQTEVVFQQGDAAGGDICFLLSCSKLVNQEFRERYEHNIVIHASDLPQGKGFTPWKWQIVQGSSELTLTMFEVTEEVDAGPYYMKERIHLKGTELLDEIQEILANKILDMCERYVQSPERFPASEQRGEESFYPRLTREDDRLDAEKSIAEQFDHFRIADNERFPLWFSYRGERYLLKIYREKREQ